jgi:hypothetical protein
MVRRLPPKFNCGRVHKTQRSELPRIARLLQRSLGRSDNFARRIATDTSERIPSESRHAWHAPVCTVPLLESVCNGAAFRGPELGILEQMPNAIQILVLVLGIRVGYG